MIEELLRLLVFENENVFLCLDGFDRLVGYIYTLLMKSQTQQNQDGVDKME